MALADEDGPLFMAGGFQSWPPRPSDEQNHRGVPHRRGHTLGRAPPGRCSRARAVLPPGYVDNLVTDWLPALDGSAKLRARAPGWPTSAAVTAPPPSSWPRPVPTESSASTTTRRRSSRARQAAARPASPTGSLRGRRRRVLPRHRVRPGRLLRRPARHGRPRRRGRARRAALPGRHRAAGRAARGPPGGQPQPGGARLYAASTFLCTPHALAEHGRTGLGAQAGPEPGSRRAGRGRLHPPPPRRQTPFNIVWRPGRDRRRRRRKVPGMIPTLTRLAEPRPRSSPAGPGRRPTGRSRTSPGTVASGQRAAPESSKVEPLHAAGCKTTQSCRRDGHLLAIRCPSGGHRRRSSLDATVPPRTWSRWLRPRISSQSRHSARTVRIQRSAYAFALGNRPGGAVALRRPRAC